MNYGYPRIQSYFRISIIVTVSDILGLVESKSEI